MYVSEKTEINLFESLCIFKVWEGCDWSKRLIDLELSRSEEEIYTVKVALGQLQDTEKMLIPYLQTNNKRSPPVDYTGMDSIFVDEYDGITDIWEDTTIYEDPDYDPEEEGANP